jgi:simple sugar transport system ATP-binding protein
LRDIHKRFGETRALAGATLEVEAGEVHALLGENGAGKTTLVRVLFGSVRPDSGAIELDGSPVQVASPAEALGLGVALVHQHPHLVPALSVAENLSLGEPGSPWLPPDELRTHARAVLAVGGLDVDPDARAGDLPIGVQQRIEIARALARDVRVLVLDEPTAVLAPSEVDELLALLAGLKEQGRAVVLITHKLEEITQVCDRVTVLRAGRTVSTSPVAGATSEELGTLMVGDVPPPSGRPPDAPAASEPALRLQGVRVAGFAPLDLEVAAGEIVGVAGIEGNGQLELEQLLAGVRAPEGGAVELLRPPLAVLSGDRQHTGLVLELSVEENLQLEDAARGGSPPIFGRAGVLSPNALREAGVAAIERFGIRAGSSDPASALSGGNQQKVCVARALVRDPGVLVAVNPTRGLDLAATAAVRDELRARAVSGGAVVLMSTDLDEILELSHRVVVLFRGALLEVPADAQTRGEIGRRMLGES